MAFTLVVIVLLTGINPGQTYSQRGQSLNAIPTDIPPETTSVDLTTNNIHQITDSDFSGTHVIEELILENNLIDIISDNAFSPLIKLKKLYVTNNRFTSMPPLQPLSSTLKELMLDKNQITSLNAN